ncbi:MAG: pyridoxal phosphate-dependent aminotransferase [Anaerovoracaceae bacterium]|nr:pyridoxal phosphate-dependent aminotransferase [Anaerovoracaceae bacterium]
MRTSVIAENMPVSGIRKMFALAAEYENVINLCIGEPDFDTPQHIIDAGSYALNHGYTKYVANSGLPLLRKAIAEKMTAENHVECSENNVMVTNGAGQALMSAVQCALNPGESIIIADPYYPNYLGYFALAGVEVIAVPTKESEQFHLTAEAIEKAMKPSTKAVLINSPSNPTGAVLSFDELKKIADLAKRKDLIVISDEPYESIVYNKRRNYSIAALPGMFERTITINSFSKTFAMTGWRVGYAVAEESFINAMTVMQESLTSSVNAASQYAAYVALKSEKDDVEKMRKIYEERADLLEKGLNRIKGFSFVKPEGAFYAFVNIKETGMTSTEVSQKLIEECQVVTTPGSAFGSAGEGYIRISFASSSEVLEEALERIQSVFGMK